MPLTKIAVLAALASAFPLGAAAPAAKAKAPEPKSYQSGGTVATGDPQLVPSPSPAPAAPVPASPVAQAEIEPEIEDDAEALSPTAEMDLAKAETKLLAKISEGLGVEAESILYNIEENAPAEKPGIGVNEVKAASLYAELAKRAIAEDAPARQALSLAVLRGDLRAKQAKDEAFENRVAESLIKRFDNGDLGAKDELMKQALKGNKKARAYLGLDKPIPVSAPEAITTTSKKEEEGK